MARALTLPRKTIPRCCFLECTLSLAVSYKLPSVYCLNVAVCFDCAGNAVSLVRLTIYLCITDNVASTQIAVTKDADGWIRRKEIVDDVF